MTDASTGVPRRADAARNRDRLVAAARKVFERDGYVRARITDISSAAGLAHGSFFSHFRGKDDVLAAVLGQIEDRDAPPKAEYRSRRWSMWCPDRGSHTAPTLRRTNATRR